MTHEEHEIEIEQAHYRRAEKRQRSKDDVQQSRLIPEDPAIDVELMRKP